jgi:D-inositol-3-phosphate glycosyltransferase
MTHQVTLLSLPAGGIAHYSYALADALQASGVTSTVLMYDEPQYDLVGFPHAHRAITRLRLGTSTATRLTSSVANVGTLLGAARGSDIVHYQWPLGPRHDPVHWRMLRALGKKIIYTAHDVLPHEPNVMSLSHCRWLYNHADALIVHGDNLKQLMVERFAVGPEKVHVVPHGNYNFVADTPSRWDRASSRASFGWDEKDRVVLFFGLIRPYKGLDDLIEACRIVDRRGLPDGRRLGLIIAGRAVANHWEEGGYQEQINKAGLEGRVRLNLEHIPMLDVARFFRASDVVAVPYKRGSQSGVLQLAFSFTRPAIATQVGSLEEAAQGGRTARVVPPENPEALAVALWDLLASPDEASKLAQSGRSYAEIELGWDDIVKKTVKVYQAAKG